MIYNYSNGNIGFVLLMISFVPSYSAASEPTGKVTEFALPTASSAPNGIAAGLDGNLWIAETGGNKIARVTPAGVVTEFELAAGSLPSGITAGPDRNMWFSMRGGVGRITLAGDVTVYKIDGIISSIAPVS